MDYLLVVLLLLAALGHIYLIAMTVIPKHYPMPSDAKYVALRLNRGRLGNQLFHLITGYGIARTLHRIHYLPFQPDIRDYVQRYLDLFEEVFPRLQETYVLAQGGINETVVPFGGSCCSYDDPHRLVNHSAKYILLNFMYGQNPSYFEEYVDDIRRILKFSPRISTEGNSIIRSLKMERNSSTCIHIRRTDFVELNVSTDVTQTVQAANFIARQLKTSRFMIFGDDQEFMHDLGNTIV
ncbi:hypothetical protein GCK32_016250, partial [Trichostrongylus colubriformis]